MFRRYSILSFFVSVTLNAWLPASASAQDELSSCKFSSGDAAQMERLEDNSRFYGTIEHPARIICDDMQFFADFAETFKKKDMVTAQGHVVYVSSGNRIAADRMEFNTKTRTGTFYNARVRRSSVSRAKAPTAACSAARSPTPISGENR